MTPDNQSTEQTPLPEFDYLEAGKPEPSTVTTDQPVLTATPGKDAPDYIAKAAQSVTEDDIIAAHGGLSQIDPSLVDAGDVGMNMRVRQIEMWLSENAAAVEALIAERAGPVVGEIATVGGNAMLTWFETYGERLASLLEDHFQNKV